MTTRAADVRERPGDADNDGDREPPRRRTLAVAHAASPGLFVFALHDAIMARSPRAMHRTMVRG
ncbi:MAG: hypothetical protein OXO52_20210 [Rhodospirillales bacterium]|nr:hypothetical protein [Rhodospirillales bacterium]MDE0380376.1 hypothetical protein [Rhodospirillales bacterium]